MRYRIIRYIKLYNPIAKKTFALLALFCAFLASSQEQKISESFKKTADDLILKAPVIYSEIDIVLRPYRSDTILMRSFANLSAKKKLFPWTIVCIKSTRNKIPKYIAIQCGYNAA